MQVFQAYRRHTVRGEIIFSGPAPYDFANSEEGHAPFIDGTWLVVEPELDIDHPDRDAEWICTGVECYAVPWIHKGDLLGLRMVKVQ